jgi:glycosyltransferase involved in cell wall biosynthesis
MKLIIQIPCLNEEETLPETIADLPKSIPGVDVIEYLVIDDGSTDRTVEVAKRLGVHHIIRLGSNRGLATAFCRGMEYALAQGAEILVNTDADNQYCGADIPKLIEPILLNEADLVIGCRPIINHPEFGVVKKILERLGSWTLRKISNTTVRDAPSGFRAFSRETCQRIFLHSHFSHCMETLIQAGRSGIRVASVDIRVNLKTRESRLFKSIPQYLRKSGETILWMFVLYRPLAFFTSLACIPFSLAVLLGLRFLYLVFWLTEPTTGRTYIPSLILLSVLAVCSVTLFALGIIGEILRSQRRVSEEILFMQRRMGAESGSIPQYTSI